jgi:hypothetical protein
MTRQTRAEAGRPGGLALLALLASFHAAQAGPFGSTGYAPPNGHATPYAAPGRATCVTCATPAAAIHHPGHKVDCPEPYSHVHEGPPRLKWKKGCPRPVCDPCELPHFGYFQTCWSPWPYPPDRRHCPYPTASDMLPPPRVPPYTPKYNAPRPGEADYFVEPRGGGQEWETPRAPRLGRDRDPDAGPEGDGPDMDMPRQKSQESDGPERLDPPRDE